MEVYDALVPLTPGRLGKRRGDVLSAIVDDVDGVVDRELRVRMPARVFVLVTLLAGAVAWLLLPVAGLTVALSAGLSGTWRSVSRGSGPRAAERATVERRASSRARWSR